MSQTLSPGADKLYGPTGLRIWGRLAPRSTDAGLQRSDEPPKRRGAPPSICEEDLLALIGHDLATSPFTGEGHRKLWPRLRVRGGAPRSQTGAAIDARESTSRAASWPPQGPKAHDGKIITMTPNPMWR